MYKPDPDCYVHIDSECGLLSSPPTFCRAGEPVTMKYITQTD